MNGWYFRAHHGHGKSTTGYSRIPDTSTAGGIVGDTADQSRAACGRRFAGVDGCRRLGIWQVERHAAHALLDVQLFRQSSFSRNLGASLLNYVGAYFFTLLAPIYLQVLLGLPVALAGMLLMLPPLVSLVANPLAGI